MPVAFIKGFTEVGNGIGGKHNGGENNGVVTEDLHGHGLFSGKAYFIEDTRSDRRKQADNAVGGIVKVF